MKSLYPTPRSSGFYAGIKSQLAALFSWLTADTQRRNTLIGFALLLLALLYIFPVIQVGPLPDTRQWDPKLQSVSGDEGGLYRLNRLTGSIYVLRGDSWEKPPLEGIIPASAALTQIEIDKSDTMFDTDDSFIVRNNSPFKVTAIKGRFVGLNSPTVSVFKRCSVHPFDSEKMIIFGAPDDDSRFIADTYFGYRAVPDRTLWEWTVDVWGYAYFIAWTIYTALIDSMFR